MQGRFQIKTKESKSGLNLELYCPFCNGYKSFPVTFTLEAASTELTILNTDKFKLFIAKRISLTLQHDIWCSLSCNRLFNIYYFLYELPN